MSIPVRIIALAILGKLELLWSLFDYVSVPQAVYDEVTTNNGVRNVGAIELQESVQVHYIAVYRVKEEKFPASISHRLHRGEIEVVIAAKEFDIKMVVIDEKLARNYAREQGLTSMGVIGLLLLAKK